MSKKAQQVIRNMVYILLLELFLLPAGIVLYLLHGFHIYHVILGFGYLYAFGLVIETAHILIKHLRFVDEKESQIVSK